MPIDTDEMNDRVLRGLAEEEVPPSRPLCPPGCAIIECIGWDEDGRFTATIVFPNGAPDLPLGVAVDPIPVRLVVAEEPDNG